MTSEKRLYSLDLLKTAAIICICALHFPWCGDIGFYPQMTVLGALRRFFFAFNACAVPLFMAVNGALLLNRPFDAKKHLKNTVTLFVQYVFWRAVTILIIAAYEGFDFGSVNLTTWVNALILLNDFPAVNVNHLWFMPMLICIYVWLPLLKAAFDRIDKDGNGIWLILPFMGAIAVFAFLFEDIALISPVVPLLDAAKLGGWQLFLPLSGTRYCSMLFYFIAGGLLVKYRDRLRTLSVSVCCAGIAVALVLLYFEWRLNSSYSGETYDNVFLSYDNLPCLLLTVCVFMLALRCEEALGKRRGLCRLLKAVGSNTMSVYYFHWILASTVFEVFHIADGLIFNFLKGALLTAICVVISLLFKRIPGLRKLVH
ncbi:MAG: acyltransferase [Eubacteriales bacterium]|nr:acyltransferase [Eubacteriales bacterium]